MAEPLRDFEALVHRWRSILGSLRDEAEASNDVLADALVRADSADGYQRTRRMLLEVAAISDGLTDDLADLRRSVDSQQGEWLAERRYTEDGLADLERDLLRESERRPSDAARRWIHEIIDAARAREFGALAQIASASLPFASELHQGAEVVRSLASDSTDFDKALELWETVAAGTLPGWEDVLDAKTKSRAHRLSAWLALRRLGDAELAEKHLDEAIKLDSYGGPSIADRAGLYLSLGDLDRAGEDARRAIDVAPNDPAGHLMLGAWAELSGQFDDALELYRRGLDKMPLHVVARVGRRASLVDPPGNLLYVAAEILVEAGRFEAALEACEGALAAGLRSAQGYPEAGVYQLKARALEQTGAPVQDVAAAELEAGKRFHWGGATDEAIECLRRARNRGGAYVPEAGWFLADATAGLSFPPGAAEPDQEIVREAHETWDGWAEEVGTPTGSTAWAYLTRAVIAEFESYALGEAHPRRWEAVVHSEQALVQDDTSGLAWGVAAKYLRAAGLEEVAFEAVQRAYELDPTNQTILGERMAMLANRGRLPEADAMAIELLATWGDDPWVKGVRAWIAFHLNDSTGALALLESPIAHDPSWYYALSALCHLDLWDVESALDDYRAILDVPPADSTIKFQLAVACVALRDLEAAERWMDDARADPTADAADSALGAGLIALAKNEFDQGAKLLLEAIDLCSNEREVDDILRNTRLRLRAVDDGDDRARAREDAVDRLAPKVAARKGALALQPASVDTELAMHLAKLDPSKGAQLGPEETGLLAARSRRQAAAGTLDAAAAGYEQLRGSMFEPEATLALRRVIAQASAEHAKKGNVEEVQRLQEGLRSLGAADAVTESLAVASALESAGRVAEARRHLHLIESDVDENTEREAVHRRLGELALEAGDLVEAEREIAAALDVARNEGDLAHVAQLETRLAMVALARDDGQNALVHFRSALASWQAAGAFEPFETLVSELQGYVSARVSGEWAKFAGAALQAMIEGLSRETELGSDDYSLELSPLLDEDNRSDRAGENSHKTGSSPT